MKITAGTVARTAVLFLALINQILAMSGKQVLDIAENDVYQVVSLLFTIGAAMVSWWKNNSFTHEAVQSDKYMHKLKSGGDKN